MSDTVSYTTETETPNGQQGQEPPDPPCCVVPPEPDGGVTSNPDEN